MLLVTLLSLCGVSMKQAEAYTLIMACSGMYPYNHRLVAGSGDLTGNVNLTRSVYRAGGLQKKSAACARSAFLAGRAVSYVETGRMPAELTGTVTHITYHSDENHYTVLRLSTETGEVTVVGTFPSVAPGEELRLTGEWHAHPQYGRQFRALTQQRVLPATREGILRFLSSGLIKGIGPAFARRLVDQFGVDTLRIIAQEPQRLGEVAGLGEQRRHSLIQGIATHHAVQDIMVFLQGLGISPGLAARIYKRYGNDAVDRLRRDPYKLADEVYGVGFRTADQLARNMGIASDAPERAKAAVQHCLQNAAQAGHLCLPTDTLVQDVGRLGVSPEPCRKAIAELASIGRLVVEEAGDSANALVYLPSLHLAEREVARLLHELSVSSSLQKAQELPLTFSSQAVAPVESTHTCNQNSETSLVSAMCLSPEQEKAVHQALAGGVTIITGGPGTGKTTIIRSIIEQAAAQKRQVLLAAPTGRAAKRLQEATGAAASTIHRLLGYGQSAESGGLTFEHHAGNPLSADMLVIDEVSMLDVPLAYHLLQAIRPGTALVLVGDADQLPSVGPGSFLRDLVAAGCLPVQRLTTVFRQAQESMIVVNAHRINRGELPIYNQMQNDARLKNFFLIEESQVEQMAARVCELMVKRLPKYMGCDPITDIQVLSPIRRGPAGVQNLNRLLQQALNPHTSTLAAEQTETLLPGDRVMQVRNNYDKRVFNGDIGTVVLVDPDNGDVQVRYPDREEGQTVIYTGDEVSELTLAYATSVHKSQGSEFPVVIVALPRVMPALMTRNLLYTAVTRARKLVVLVGERRIIAGYIRNDTAYRRYGRLIARLQALAEL